MMVKIKILINPLNSEVGLTLKDYMKEKESNLKVFSMNFRKEVEKEHGDEILKKLQNPTKFVKLKRKSKKENLLSKNKEGGNDYILNVLYIL